MWSVCSLGSKFLSVGYSPETEGRSPLRRMAFPVAQHLVVCRPRRSFLIRFLGDFHCLRRVYGQKTIRGTISRVLKLRLFVRVRLVQCSQVQFCYIGKKYYRRFDHLLGKLCLLQTMLHRCHKFCKLEIPYEIVHSHRKEI